MSKEKSNIDEEISLKVSGFGEACDRLFKQAKEKGKGPRGLMESVTSKTSNVYLNQAIFTGKMIALDLKKLSGEEASEVMKHAIEYHVLSSLFSEHLSEKIVEFDQYVTKLMRREKK